VVAKFTTFLPTNSKLTNQHETKKTQKCKCRQKHRSSFFLPKILLPATAPHGQAGPRARRQLHGRIGNSTASELERIGNLGVAWLVFRPGRWRRVHYGRWRRGLAWAMRRRLAWLWRNVGLGRGGILCFNNNWNF